MLKGLFSTPKSILPPPPKNQIEVACPACGSAQYEPKLVVSTFCKSCGVHLSIHKRKVTASTVTRSGAVGVNDLWDRALPPGQNKRPAASAPSPPPDNPPTPESVLTSPEPAGVSVVEAAHAGFGAFLQAVSSSPSRTLHHVNAESGQAPPPIKTAPVAPLIPSVPAPPPNSTLEKMKAQGAYRQQYFKDIQCFECGHVFKVSRSMKSAACTGCGAAICIEDLDINQRVTTPIRTRGDVIVRKPGVVSTTLIECRDLRCLGLIEAEIRCQNEAVFRTEGPVKGCVNCRKLTIEKGADVTFFDPVHAGEMHINARVTGTLHATGRIVIGPYGSVNGDVTARAVTIEPGGELNGAMNIVRASAPATSAA